MVNSKKLLIEMDFEYLHFHDEGNKFLFIFYFLKHIGRYKYTNVQSVSFFFQG